MIIFAHQTQVWFRIMSKIGYVLANVKSAVKQKMVEYGVHRMFIDEVSQSIFRPKFREAIKTLKDGDELILASFHSTVKSINEFALLLDFCNLKHIRLISIEDEIDTKDILFAKRSTQGILNMCSNLPTEIIRLRQSLGEERLQAVGSTQTNKRVKRQMRDRLVIALYLAGHSLDMITKRVGIKHSAIYNILKRNGIGRSRIVRESNPDK